MLVVAADPGVCYKGLLALVRLRAWGGSASFRHARRHGGRQRAYRHEGGSHGQSPSPDPPLPFSFPLEWLC